MAIKANKSSVDSETVAMNELRKIILGENGEQITTVVRANAREIVRDVLVEAIHDRQAQDDELNQVLAPTVNKSVETTVQRHSEEFVGYIYPLVGRLVRKSVTAFLREFLDKTNELLENSLTIKGLLWRYNAWRSGVSFSQYVVSQTFTYKVEQVLLIHSETGILLNSVTHDTDSTESELVSAMLTAINDFVADSFQRPDTEQAEEQNLEVIKTAGLTLVIKRGPTLFLVAAVKGNIPQELSNQFEQTNESIHRLFANDISSFNGDVRPFEATSQLLQECLIAKPRFAGSQRAKKPYLAIILLVLVAVALVGVAINAYQHSQRLLHVREINNEPGIVVHRAEKLGWRGIELSVLRDPNAIDVQTWLKQVGLNPDDIIVSEKPYLSLERELVESRIRAVVRRYPGLTTSESESGFSIIGNVSQVSRAALNQDLLALPGVTDIEQLLAGVTTTLAEGLSDDSPEVLKAMFDSNAAKINRTEIQFEPSQSVLGSIGKAQLERLGLQISSIIRLSQQLKINIGVIIMGASDSSGSASYNQKLSSQRAEVVRQSLIEQGVESAYLHAIGLGVVEMESSGVGIRKVIFNVIEIDATQTQGQQDL